MNEEVWREAEHREISRLCHLTPYRNLVHIVTGKGLVSTARLSKSERRVFNQQDLDRLDEHPGHISCSVEFPNSWYLRQRRLSVRGADRLFPDWVCLCIEPKYLWREDTLFCPRNAAAGRGRYVAAGVATFLTLFSEEVAGARGRTFKRSNVRQACCPTDEQAEVLVHSAVDLSDIQRVVVRDVSQAKRTYIGLEQLGVPADRVRYAICPQFFDPNALSVLLNKGLRPPEEDWDPRSMIQ